MTVTVRYSALWQADREHIQRMAPIEYIGRYMRGWFDFAIADELHQLAGDTAQGNGLGVLGRFCKEADRIDRHFDGRLCGRPVQHLLSHGAAHDGRRGICVWRPGTTRLSAAVWCAGDIEKVRETDNACSRATKKTIQVLKKPGASPLLFGKFLMTTTAFLSLEDIADNLPRYDESVLSVEMDEELAKAYEELEEDIRSAIRSHRGNKSLMSILLNTLLLYPDHPYGFEDIWARAFDPETKEYVKFLVTTPQNLKEDGLYARNVYSSPTFGRNSGRVGAASLCDLHGREGCYAATGVCAQAGRLPGCRAALFGCHRQARGLVRAPVEGWS